MDFDLSVLIITFALTLAKSRQEESDFLLSWFITGSLSIGAAIGGIEIITKMILYYLHERAWYRFSKFGVNDKNRGEAIKAFIVSSNNKLTAQEIISYCKAGLTEYKVPKSVVFLDELPKTNVGKILRRELRNL